MALLNKLDPQMVAERLTDWLPAVLNATSEITVSDVQMPTASGMSSETILFDASWQADGESKSLGLVVRIPPSDSGLFPDYDIEREARVMAAIARHSAAAVPGVLALDLSGDVLGTPFVLLERAYGRVPGDDPPFVTGGWVTELSAAQRATMFDNALCAIAEIQKLDPDAVGLGDLGHPGTAATPLGREIEYWKSFYTWAAAGKPSATIDAAFQLLEQDVPSGSEHVVVSWGDSRFGNLMFDDDLRVSGVFDWEMATLAPPEADFGYFLFVDRMYSSGIGLPPMDGFPAREAAIHRIEELLGRPLERIEWFEAWGALRGTILLQRVGNLMIEQGLLPQDADMPFNNPASQVLAKLLDLPAPAGEAGWITGNR
jgi:aminoglycoside phosphotransferase (APT) family kinase protein